MVGVQNIKFLIKKGDKYDLKEVHFAKTLVAIDVIRGKNYEFYALAVNQITVYS